ncbi:AAA family ATPase [Methanocalculus sp.]|uniref:AAA family ATPase n=1 Tax=Methanocalculus sp. TaxID=2004547 RepID=UPI002607FD5E|nr:AAA family ATPase [Methanocalculus sp.]MDG6250461.1 AAA family ATPase [Methanocalculus sp.]
MGRIHTLHIENFRAIGSLDYAPRQLNIICGKNNTAKSALLDAIFLNGTGEYKRDQFLLNENRENLIKVNESKATIYSNLNAVTIYQSLDVCKKEDQKTYEHIKESIILIRINQIENYIKDIEDNDKLREAYIEVIFESLEYIIITSDLSYQIIPYQLIERQKIFDRFQHVIENSEKVKLRNRHFYLLKSRIFSPISLNRPSNKSLKLIHPPIIKVSHEEKLSPERMDDEEIHLLEQFIKEHNLVRNLERLTQNNILYRRGDEIETIPISAHGDGFITLLSLFHYLRKSQDGILLIEEPENHLHPEYLAIFIETLFTYAPKLNVQVFMTTHSYDLIQTALDYPEDDAEKELLLISKMTSDGETIEKYDYTVDEGRRVTEELKLDLRGI